MSLQWYRRQRLVVLNPTTPVLDAARAIENNSIGSVVVQDQGTELVKRLNLDAERARQILGAVASTIAQNVSPGQVKDIQSQLPEELREVFAA
jgi:hypothetical protein